MQPLPPSPQDKGFAFIFAVAAGSAFGHANITVDRGGSSLVDQRPGKKLLQVPVVRVADYVPRNKYTFYFKSDTQGYEMHALQGARELFEEGIVRLVHVELWPKGLKLAGTSPGRLVDLLVGQWGFTCFDSQPGKLPYMHPEAADKYLNVVERAQGTNERFGWFDDLLCLSVNFAKYRNPY